MSLVNTFILGVVSIALATMHIASAVHALLNKRDPYAALVWVSICLFIPVFGPLIYITLGFNRIHRRASKLVRKNCGHDPATAQSLEDCKHARIWQIPNIAQTDAEEEQEETDAVSSPRAAPLSMFPPRIRRIARIAEALTDVPMTFGNSVTPLFNGEEAYPAMLEAINGARKKIWLITYIFDNDTTGKKFIEALASAVERGVDVRVLVDGVGTFLTHPRIDKSLKKRGIKVARFLPPRLIPPQFSINLRNHRKLLLVDNGVSFTGGMNISDTHLLHKPAAGKKNRNLRTFSSPDTAKDTHFKVDGPIVNTLQRIFTRDWELCTGERLALGKEDVCTEVAGKAFCRSILDGPDDFFDVFLSTLLGVISSAKSSINIMTPYFLPPRELATALQSAVLRGVQVNVIIPSECDHNFVQWSTFNCLRSLLERGIKIYFQPPPFDHSKILLIDGSYLHIGSANMDPRSFRLNFELTMEVLDLPLAAKMEQYFKSVQKNSHEYTLAEFNSRPLHIRIRDALFWLMSPYL